MSGWQFLGLALVAGPITGIIGIHMMSDWRATLFALGLTAAIGSCVIAGAALVCGWVP